VKNFYLLGNHPVTVGMAYYLLLTFSIVALRMIIDWFVHGDQIKQKEDCLHAFISRMTMWIVGYMYMHIPAMFILKWKDLTELMSQIQLGVAGCVYVMIMVAVLVSLRCAFLPIRACLRSLKALEDMSWYTTDWPRI
jgi:hypothetical protein